MKRKDIVSEVSKALDVRLAWRKDYGNGTMVTQYTLYYNRRARKPLGWLEICHTIYNDDVIGGADIITHRNGEQQENEIRSIENIEKIIADLFGIKK